MGVAKTGVRIARPVEDVFRVLSDPENSPKWNSNSLKVVNLTPGPMRVGSRRRATVKRMFGMRPYTNEAEMVEYVPNERMVVKSLGGPFTWRTVIVFERVPEGTAIDWTWIFERPGGMLGLLSPLLPAAMRREFQRDLEDLKRLMESGAL